MIVYYITIYTLKGKRCKELGIEVLIDDDIKGVILGCTKYNIPLIDTNEISSL